MNHHEFIDIATLQVSVLIQRKSKYFASGLDSPPLVEVASEASASVKDVDSSTVREVTVQTPVGDFDVAYRRWRWLGPEYPTIVYCPSSEDRPFESGRFGSNSVQEIFAVSGQEIPANLVVIRPAFQTTSLAEIDAVMGNLQTFVGMVSASVGLVEALAVNIRERANGPIFAVGMGLGGTVINVHRACFSSIDRYAPMFAGAALDEAVISPYFRKLVAESAHTRPGRLRKVLNFEDEFTAIKTVNCAPLLARYDRFTPFDRQRACFDGLPLHVLEKGYMTGRFATAELREYLIDGLSSLGKEAGGR